MYPLPLYWCTPLELTAQHIQLMGSHIISPISHLYSCTMRYHEIPELLGHLFVIKAWSHTADLLNHRLWKLHVGPLDILLLLRWGLDFRHWKHKILTHAVQALFYPQRRIASRITSSPTSPMVTPLRLCSC